MKLCFADHEEQIRSLEKELRAEIAKSSDARAALAKAELLEAQVVRLTAENSKLTDRVMIANGHLPIYEQPKKTEVGEQVTAISRATDYCKEQERSEEELDKQERLAEGKRALEIVMADFEKETKKGATNAAN